MFQKHGANTLNHITSVLNSIEDNYDNEFNDEIEFVIAGDRISTSSGMDLWSPDITDASALLDEFENSNFTTDAYDLASLWVTRDIWGTNNDGSPNLGTVGNAYRPGVCRTDFKYNLIEDYTASTASLRVLFAHEIGHNFGASHDTTSGDIMAEAVNITDTWSDQSESQINAYYPGATCLCAIGDRADLVFQFCGIESIDGDVLTISSTQIKNNGTIASGPFNVGWYLSSDDDITPDDYRIGNRFINSVAAGSTSFGNPMVADLSNVNVPGGNYYLGTIIDYEFVVAEFDEENNIDCISSSADITVPGAACVTNYTVPANHTSNEHIEVSDLQSAMMPVLEFTYKMASVPNWVVTFMPILTDVQQIKRKLLTKLSFATTQNSRHTYRNF